MSDDLTKMGGEELQIKFERQVMAPMDSTEASYELYFTYKEELLRRLAKLERLEKENKKLKAQLKKFTQANYGQRFSPYGIQM